MRHEVDQRTELVEGEIWDVVRDSIQAGAMVRVMESATRIAAAHDKVMPLAEIAELLAEAAIAAGVPIEIEGLPLTARVSGSEPTIPIHSCGREFVRRAIRTSAPNRSELAATRFARMEQETSAS